LTESLRLLIQGASNTLPFNLPVRDAASLRALPVQAPAGLKKPIFLQLFEQRGEIVEK
jgi:hypothetical protein